MVFEVLAPYINDINDMLAAGEGATAISKKLGIPGRRPTIQRYKIEVYDKKIAEVAEKVVDAEKALRPEEWVAVGVDREVMRRKNLELMHKNALALQSVQIGQEFTDADGNKREVTIGTAAAFWDTGHRIAATAIRLDQEISGNDPESRKAAAMEGWGEPELRRLYQYLVEDDKARDESLDD